MLITSELKFIRVSPRKMRLLVDSIKSLKPKKALENLEFINKTGNKYLIKLIESALANAVNNKQLKEETLKFNKIEVSEGPKLKRFRPVSRGMAHQYKHRTSHVRIVLEG